MKRATEGFFCRVSKGTSVVRFTDSLTLLGVLKPSDESLGYFHPSASRTVFTEVGVRLVRTLALSQGSWSDYSSLNCKYSR